MSDSAVSYAPAQLARSAERLAAGIATLSVPPFTDASDAICRYAWSPGYQATLAWFDRQFTELGFTCTLDPIGNFVARNRPPGEPAMGLGSHCDSNRQGGPYDGTLGVLAALEACRLNAEHGLDLPLQVTAFLEEEASGFGVLLLGSRVVAGQLTADDLATGVVALDDGRSFAEHAREAGLAPERAAEARHMLDGLVGWIEPHIEQGRVLQDAGDTLGLVHSICGYEHGDLFLGGRADHAGATPMIQRRDAAIVAAWCVGRLEELTLAIGGDTVGTVGEFDVTPGIINVIPGAVRISYDVRGTDDTRVDAVVAALMSETRAVAEARGISFAHERRQRVPAQALDASLGDVLERAARSSGAPWRSMPSGAAHDTMAIAPLVPSAMLFIPCRDGISHHPSEHADMHHAAIATHVMLDAARAWLEAVRA
ncbi:MAG: Zn-dependent hydrolase [Solirubrobacteraceae bacterium]|nr:Zn-dependent hydrolase [Solirubrobacteraceae bacterium]